MFIRSGANIAAFGWPCLVLTLMLLILLVTGESAEPESRDKKYPLLAKETFKQVGSLVSSLDELGTIIDNPEKWVEVGTGEIVYINVGAGQAVEVGDRYSIVREDRPVFESDDPTSMWTSRPGAVIPDTGYGYSWERRTLSGFIVSLSGWRDRSRSNYEAFVREYFPNFRKPLGTLVLHLGSLEVVELEKDFSRAVIKEAFDSIRVGDRLIAYQEPEVPELKEDHAPVSKDIQARIVAFKERAGTASLEDIVYIDKGDAEEVRVGDRFEIYIIDLVNKEKKNWYNLFPKKFQVPVVIGQLQVIAVQKSTATAVVRKAQREIFVGQRLRYVPRLLNPQ
ncbi:MAG: hypothetical protein VYC17_06250 [Nitrospinota bacterium]|nr:hypothetical protein [Nitrospinota bacterium]